MSPTRLSSFAVLLLVASSITACVAVRDVRGPDGESAHLIECADSAQCYAKAAEVCPDGYELRGGVTRNLLVSCKSDIPDEAPPVVLTSAEVPSREDSRTCEAAASYATGFGTYWDKREPAVKPLSTPVTPADFISVCRAMPENVQRCMHNEYREAHGEACDAVLLRLDAASTRAIDGLFLAAPRG